MTWYPVSAKDFPKGFKMPDLKGMGLKDALFLLENMNMKVVAKGKGKVSAQSIEPGSLLVKNQNVRLELN